MELTRDHIAAARALGFAFFPANDEQVRRFTMQRRIFRVEGKPYLVSANGTYFETHSTLEAMIKDEMAASTQAETSQPPTAPKESPETSPPSTAAMVPEEDHMAPDTGPAVPSAADGTGNATEAAASEHAGEAVGVVEPQPSAVRRRRVAEPKQPRWMTAGKARRGRLK